MRRPILSILTAVSLVGVGHASDTQNQDFGAVRVVSQHTHGNAVRGPESANQTGRELILQTDRSGDAHTKLPMMGTRNPCLGKSLHIVDNRGC